VPIVAESFGVVIGVDTHAATHTLVAVNAATAARQAEATFPTSRAGLARATTWVLRQAGDPNDLLVVVEGVGSFGATLTRLLVDSGLTVVEAASSHAADRRGKGKSDSLDAARIARGVLGTDIAMLRWPRADGIREAMRVLVVAREEMTGERTRAINALTALVRTIDLGLDARRPLSAAQITLIANWRNREEGVAARTGRLEAVRLARRITELNRELATNHEALGEMAEQSSPQLLALTGVGPVVAATVLLAWSHPGRVRSEAAFASLAGTCPIPASSGNTTRYRLNRGGDRRLNRAITTIALVRLRRDPQTRDYAARRTAEGRTKKEIRRCIKRYITRQLYRTLTPPPKDAKAVPPEVDRT
jgi:transposase